ncbi:DNA polymerase III subunit beta [Rosistilla oblonga]|uniref:Beta sliding clamp n=1 Tax=Rosistilla oblonga TaxID=2527990 RepID=A0A518ILU6_9BACT|nr:DNA polymerase III subunit beta [Rosistilla oblonga]QDV54061.1 DNA polymerase III subunit beta [Rosistilla oblonga]
MKITCERETFAAAFQLAAGVAPSRSPKAILQNVKIIARDGAVTLSATDMEVGIHLNVDGVEIETDGTALLPVQRVSSILRESSDEHLTFEASETGIKVRGSRSRFQLPGANPDEFPSVATFQETSYHEIATRLFRELVRRTVFATDAESGRYALGGVLLEMEGERVTAVGTDGRRLATMTGTGVSIGEHKTSGTNTIVPNRSISLIERALNDKDETVEVAARSNDLLVRTPRCTIYSRLVEGRYPNWRQVLPQRDDVVTIDLTIGPLHAALRQAAIVTDHESRGIDFTFGEGTMLLEANTAEVGESRVEMPIGYEGEPIKVTLDHRFLADFCKVLDAERTVQMEIESSDRPALLTTDDGFQYVVMPMARDR